MSLRVRIALLIILITGLIVTVSYYFLATHTTNSFTELEKRETIEKLSIVKNVYKRNMEQHDTTTRDWARWDELYEYVEDPNEKFEETNLGESTFNILSINMILILDENFQTIFYKTVDDNGKETQNSKQFENKVLQFLITNDEKETKGLIELPDHTLIITSIKRIYHSNELGNSNGYLILAKYFNKNRMDKLSGIVETSLNIKANTDPNVPGDMRCAIFSLADEEYHTMIVPDDENLAAYTYLEDINENPVAVLKMLADRTMLNQAKKELTWSLYSLILLGFAFCVSMIFLVQKIVVSRLAYLNDTITNIYTTKKLDTRVTDIHGVDEIARLGMNLNRMLDSLEKYQANLQFMGLHDGLTKLNNRMCFQKRLEELNDVRTLAILICDVDGLKLVNDSMGHHEGDLLLTNFSSILKESIKESDTCCIEDQGRICQNEKMTIELFRIGGDEFAILISNKLEKCLYCLTERINKLVAHYNKEKNPKIPLSVSIGHAACFDGPINSMQLFQEADNKMYREKLHHSQSNRSALVQALISALEARDFVTEGHSARVEQYVQKIGYELKLQEDKITDLKLLAQFHDLGKVGIPDRILFKPDKLTAEEYEEMKRHCEIGYRIAIAIPDLLTIADFILKHHEWWDGKGYPLGLSGEEIPLECRVLAIADAYDAMTSDRPYRKGMSHEEAIQELKKCSGKQFDPNIVNKFIKLLKKDLELKQETKK